MQSQVSFEEGGKGRFDTEEGSVAPAAGCYPAGSKGGGRGQGMPGMQLYKLEKARKQMLLQRAPSGRSAALPTPRFWSGETNFGSLTFRILRELMFCFKPLSLW